MPNPLKNAAVPTGDYTDACAVSDIAGGRGGNFQITDGPVFYQLQYGTRGQFFWTEEGYTNPGAGSISEGATGVRFRNATSTVATASASIAPPNQPILIVASTTGLSAALNVSTLPLASFPPSAPTDGDTYWLELPAAYDPIGGKAIRWLVVYNAALAMWNVSGPPLYAEVQTQETLLSAAYTDLATVGPSQNTPRPGDYILRQGCAFGAAGNGDGAMSVSIGGAAAVDADAAMCAPVSGSGFSTSVVREREKTGLAATTVVAKYRGAGAAARVFERRWLEVAPLRIT